MTIPVKTLNELIAEVEKDFPRYHSKLINTAMWFASNAHKAALQTRKHTGLPYITHPMAVAAIVAENGGDESMICAAWLHDTVEDTDVTEDEIRMVFGNDIADLVDGLTKQYFEEDYPDRLFRNKKYAEHLAKQNSRIQTIKAADILHNSATVVEADLVFATRYIPENIYFSSLLVNACPTLRKRLADQLSDKAQQIAKLTS